MTRYNIGIEQDAQENRAPLMPVVMHINLYGNLHQMIGERYESAFYYFNRRC